MFLSERFRVLYLLGRGGMGEVYRADDLKLGQPVALKFLAPALERDPTRFRRLLREVRLARLVSHPNVCRVYDVGEYEGQHFLSMEYIDGEDLASLLRRIGRLPGDKAVQIARQICLGLAAAHDQGILHRDLKPANVMIDGRGRVRLTDFGLAVSTDEDLPADGRAGTPAYMSPEQHSGEEVTQKSDIYAVGLVLYELFTGQRPFENGVDSRSVGSSPPSPASLVTGLNPAVEQTILSCLQSDPADRPGSAVAVAKALPGDDPLTAAIAGGETPPREVVAEGRAPFVLRPTLVWVCLVAFSAMLVGALILGPHSRSLSHVGPGKPFGYLLERSRQVARLSGVPAGKAYEASGWGLERDTGDNSTGWLSPPELTFWYRRGPHPLIPSRMVVTRDDPPSSQPGMASVTLDSQGRLRRLESIPSGADSGSQTDPGTTWDTLFRLAEFDLSRFESVPPRSFPAGFADRREAWTARGEETRIEAATLQGHPVFFEVIDATAHQPAPRRPDVWSGINVLASLALFGPVLIGGLFLARHNLRQGRGDRKGAFRLASFMFGMWLAFGLAGSDHFLNIAELNILMRILARACLSFGVFWVLYMALEPYARRYWPIMLVSWIRLLDGRTRDPMVGWHLLVGATLGVAATLIEQLGATVTRLIGLHGWEPGALPLQLRGLTSLRFALAGVLDMLDFAVTTSLQVVVILLVLRFALRRTTPTVIGLFVVSLLVFAGGAVTMPTHGLIIALALVVLFRFGLLAMMSGLFVLVLLGNFLVSSSPSSPFAYLTHLAAGIAVGIAAYGCYHALATRAKVLDPS